MHTRHPNLQIHLLAINVIALDVAFAKHNLQHTTYQLTTDIGQDR